MASRKPTEPRKRPRQQRSQVTVDAIITATERVVEREGTQRANTNRIAEVAGVSIGSLYQYFPNKNSLIETLRSRENARFSDGLAPQIEQLLRLPLRDAIRRLVDLMISFHTDQLALHNALARDGGDLVAELEARWLPLVVAYLAAHRDALRPDDLELAARITLQVLETLTHGVALRSPALLADPAYADELAVLLVRYLER